MNLPGVIVLFETVRRIPHDQEFTSRDVLDAMKPTLQYNGIPIPNTTSVARVMLARGLAKRVGGVGEYNLALFRRVIM